MTENSTIHGPERDSEKTVFDACGTLGEMNEKLQGLSRDLISEAAKEHAEFSVLLDRGEIDLDVLSQFSYAELRRHPRPVHTLSEICRLLIKRGDRASYELALRLSHRLYSVKCKLKQSWFLSFLYKGAAQIGMRLTDAGVKSVLFGMYKHSGYCVVPVDRVIGRWALAGASIQTRSLKTRPG